MNIEPSRAPDWRVYSAYGHSLFQKNSISLLAFNGTFADWITGNYILGNGYRVYNPRLMRFQSADSLSPLSRGGLNAYSYCSGDPVNRIDPSGRFSLRRIWQGWTGGPKKVQSMRPLSNTNHDRLDFEVPVTDKNIKVGKARITVVKDSSSMHHVFSGASPMTHKWIVTDKGEIIVGSFRHEEVYSTHASFAHIAARDHGTSSTVVAAGEFKTKGRGIIMTNYSGHYRTPYARLWPVKRHMEQLGVDMKMVRQSYLADQQAN